MVFFQILVEQRRKLKIKGIWATMKARAQLKRHRQRNDEPQLEYFQETIVINDSKSTKCANVLRILTSQSYTVINFANVIERPCGPMDKASAS